MRGFQELSSHRLTIRQQLEAVLPKLNAMDILEHYNAENISEGEDEIIHSCIVDRVDSHHAHGDASPGASINKTSLLWNCFSYGGLDILGLIMKMEDCGEQAAINFLGNFVQGDIPVENFLLEIEQYLDRRIEPVMLPSYSPKVLHSWLQPHPYFLNRGISKQVCEEMSLGYDDVDKRVVIPHFWKGNLVGWQKRRLDGITPNVGAYAPKYKNSVHFPKRFTLYNWDNINPHAPVIVVESPMSVLWGKTIGLSNITATFGSEVNAEQLQYLGLCDQIITCFDPDKAGKHGTQTLVYNLMHVTDVKVVNDLPEGKDFADLSLESALTHLESAIPASIMEVHNDNSQAFGSRRSQRSQRQEVSQ